MTMDQPQALDFAEGGVEELQEALEVVFETESVHRRKSSLVPDQPLRPKNGRQLTSCYVHSLLDKHRENDGTFTPSLEGTLANRKGDKDPHGQQTANHNNHHTESRLLTKKQLSDMALGIRDLSKKLSHIKLKLNVRNIFVLVKAHDESLVGHARELTKWLMQKDEKFVVWVEDTMKDQEKFDAKGLIESDPSFDGRIKYWNNELCAKKPATFDIVLGLGGDGTVLYSSWLFQKIVPPVISFALGSLGFLTKFDFEAYPQILTRAITDGVTVGLRLRFEGTIMRSQKRENSKRRDLVDELIGEESEDDHTHKPDGTHNVMNEVVMDRGPNATMSTLELFGDNEHFTTVQADGICVATPTGSTAYNLAAGGSLCHPENPVILVTAICAHTLSFRPIILPDTMVLRVGVPYSARTGSWASFDGRERVELLPGDYVTISASRYPFPSVLPLDRKREDWIDSISRTLNWNSRQRQKSFDDGDGEKKQDSSSSS
ncbi:Aminopeptidase Y [Venturia nashicola]|nr:Aminopeptidase Y [Venturia nashicola]